MVTIIMLYLYFIISGKIENMIFTVKSYKGKYIDYHGLRALEHIVIFIGLIYAGNVSIIHLIANSMIANLFYEMILKGTWDIRTDRKTFNIFNLNLYYRWWFYPLLAGVGIVILVIY